ncbi:MAG: ABC transporter ATP-binding protein [Gammaproteobacteria bacterium]|nr:ABC transporter ATP-binding protein [Gammaproteobacteria bacterium]MCP4088329.1 ABC transporter ATP-binding protein [Gammaproteobacteria bacterium]MCP4276360.1 ABC transporter ATP-binding protein [Gammaproteobacteria bacterium]MCP4831007.1 ABC transporter ATP-binding protein [Gammaproteobacteria bacterium]MCP4927472.1 ABC transporter ATP-binding protein [Gammaproteobacteria bacterium]
MNSPHSRLPSAPPADNWREALARNFAVFAYTKRAVALVWETNRRLTIILVLLTLAAGLLPAAMAWIGKLIVDGVVLQIAVVRSGSAADYWAVLQLVALEGCIIGLLNISQRGINTCQSLLRAQLGFRVNEMILKKALTLDLSQFEDSEFYDKLQLARRQASTRPLSLVIRSFTLMQQLISLVSFSILIAQFSIWAMVLLIVAGLPAFVAETKFSGDAFRLFRFRAPEAREQNYLETVMAREDHVQEVKLFGLGSMLLRRYHDIFTKIYGEDRALTLRRESWGLALTLIGTIALYGAYTWIVIAAINIAITLGEMTMYLLLFRQGQAAVSAGLSSIGGMYDDNLYLTNLYEYLEQAPTGTQGKALDGPAPDDGIRFEHVSFQYPDSPAATLIDINLHIQAGESLALVGENGAGKSTLIKLLCGFYKPNSGKVLLHGRDVRDWDQTALHRCIGVIFQDFNRYQFTVGENIGVGDVEGYHDEGRWLDAARKGMAMPFVKKMPWGFKTQLGTWFKGGKELSTGQWQKIALSRAFMRSNAEVLVLDEPTAAMDAAAEAELFEYFREHTKGRIAVLISHRFSTVRQADRIAVLEEGKIIECGCHDELLAKDGLYAKLFLLQAEGYR